MARMTITLVLQGEPHELESMRTKLIRTASRLLVDCIAKINRKKKVDYSVIIDV